jgi:FixJ family two-component response regulator
MNTDQSFVLLVDDDLNVREAVSNLLSSMGFRVTSFGSAEEFLEYPKPEAPTCLILDLELPNINGLELQQKLAARVPPPIIFITGHGDVPSSVRAMKAGAIEFLSKPIGDQELLEAVELGIAIDRKTREAATEVADLQRHYDRLTPREREVLPFVVTGFANKLTASALGKSEITIGVLRGRIMRKMGAQSLADLVRMSDKLGVARAPRPS